MTYEHRRICPTCFREFKPGGELAPAYPISKLPSNHSSSSPVSNEPPSTTRGWAEWLLEWTKIALKFGYLLLALLKL